MTSPITARTLALEGWQRGIAAFVPNSGWLALFAATAGIYSASLRMDVNVLAPFAAAMIAFLAGVQLSCGLYRSLLGPQPNGFVQLAHANLAVYLAFLFFGFFVGFFLAILPGILIEAQGEYELGADAAPELVQQAFMDMLPTPYGAFYVVVAAAGFGLLSFFALRLTLYGAATHDLGKAHIFRTFAWTKGHVIKLAAAALVTHVLPFAAGLGANMLLRANLPDSAAGHVIEGAAGILLFAPFLLAAHGMAAGAYERLKPEAPVDAPAG